MNIYLDRDSELMLTQLCEVGATMCRVMSVEAAVSLANEVRGYPFTRNPSSYGPRQVRQCFSSCEESGIPYDSNVRAVSAHMSSALAGHFHRNVFQPALDLNDHLLTYYPKNMGMLGAHRDESRYVNLIVAITLDGYGQFNIHRADKNDKCTPNPMPCATFDSVPGSAILMAAPGFCGRPTRPFHSVGHVGSDRIALVLKQKIVPSSDVA